MDFKPRRIVAVRIISRDKILVRGVFDALPVENSRPFGNFVKVFQIRRFNRFFLFENALFGFQFDLDNRSRSGIREVEFYSIERDVQAFRVFVFVVIIHPFSAHDHTLNVRAIRQLNDKSASDIDVRSGDIQRNCGFIQRHFPRRIVFGMRRNRHEIRREI